MFILSNNLFKKFKFEAKLAYLSGIVSDLGIQAKMPSHFPTKVVFAIEWLLLYLHYLELIVPYLNFGDIFGL